MKLLEKLLRAVFRPIEANAVTFVALYLLGIVSAWLTVPHTPSGKLYENLYLELFLDVYILCVFFMIFPGNRQKKSVSRNRHRFRYQGGSWRGVVKFLVCLVLYAIAIADVYCFEKYGSSLTPSMLMLVGETDSREAGEFLSSVLSWETLISGVGWMLLIALFHAILSFLATKLRWSPSPIFKSTTSRHRRVTYYRHEKSSDGGNLIEAILGLLMLGLLIWSVSTSWKNKQGLWRLMTLNSVGQVENEITRYHRAEQYLPVYRLAFSIRANQLAAKQVDQLIETAGKVSVDSCSYTSPTIVLIIGESYNKHHSQLYGYYMPTTPRQLEREKSWHLIKFTDVVTSWNLTSFVFKHMFSLHVLGQEGEWCDYPLFPEVFKQAGYNVTFLTNQFLTKAKDAVYDFSGGFFLNNPQLSEAMFDQRNETTHPWDDGLLRDWDQLLKEGKVSLPDTAYDASSKVENQKGTLAIFHLLGQHMNYYSRYPKKQTHFTADDYQKHRPKMLPRRKQQLVWYDNATLYNDSIVDQIIRRFEDQDAIVIYVPDHGEEVFEPGRFVICRNHSDDIDYPLAHYEYEIPFWVWCSEKYIKARPELYRQIYAARKRPMMVDALPHMLLYLAGIHTKDYHPEYNILAPEYNAKRPRMLKGLVDYDKLPRDMSSTRTAKIPKGAKKAKKDSVNFQQKNSVK
ncbi:MAG: lipid A phosphoethanolamine transferase [Prevotella sp.]|nr:lipid A phosphoethanolamine transferase [Prevotella sp.]